MRALSSILCRGTGLHALMFRGVLIASLAAAGCANTGQAQREAAAIRAANAAMAARERAVEVEDDGMPAQVAPRRRPASEADDPREPFSPNYGRAQPAQRVGDATPVSGHRG